MHRICTTLAENGYAVTLVGRKLSSSVPLSEKKYGQKRLRCWFKRGKMFYAEYNVRLFLYLLFRRIDIVCAIDLDTILPCYYISRWKKIPRIYDAHELFTEQKEVISRPRIYKWWKKIESRLVPLFKKGYTVSESISRYFGEKYNVSYEIIRNVPLLQSDSSTVNKTESKFILYQGAVNEARGLEYLVPAMKEVPYPLIICGDGNFMLQLKKQIAQYKLEGKIILKGMLSPDELQAISRHAFIGLNLVENNGLNQYYSLANKFFDYIHAGLPQITMNFPEYSRINTAYEVAILIDETNPQIIARAINKLADDTVLYNKLQENCRTAKSDLNWQEEEKKLISFYQNIFS